MTVEAGKLNKQISIQSATFGRDALGGPSVTYTSTVLNTWARVQPLIGREYFASKQLQAVVDTKFTIRYPGTVTVAPTMQLTYNSNKYNIESVINVNEANQELVLMCSRITTV